MTASGRFFYALPEKLYTNFTAGFTYRGFHAMLYNREKSNRKEEVNDERGTDG